MPISNYLLLVLFITRFQCQSPTTYYLFYLLLDFNANLSSNAFNANSFLLLLSNAVFWWNISSSLRDDDDVDRGGSTGESMTNCSSGEGGGCLGGRGGRRWKATRFV